MASNFPEEVACFTRVRLGGANGNVVLMCSGPMNAYTVLANVLQTLPALSV